MKNKWSVGIETYININDTNRIAKYAEQGWIMFRYPTKIRAIREITVETGCIDTYLKTFFKDIPDFNMLWCKVKD